MNNNTVEQMESPGRRAAAYWFVDGLPEIAFGFALLTFGLFGVWVVALGEALSAQLVGVGGHDSN